MAELFERKPNPLFFANLTASEKIVVNQGGTFCFAPETLVITNRGEIPICEVKAGDLVKTMNEDTGEIEWRGVDESLCYANTKDTIRVEFESGEVLIASADHKIYYEGGWQCLKDVVSLLYGNMEKNT